AAGARAGGRPRPGPAGRSGAARLPPPAVPASGAMPPELGPAAQPRNRSVTSPPASKSRVTIMNVPPLRPPATGSGRLAPPDPGAEPAGIESIGSQRSRDSEQSAAAPPV